MSAIVKPMKRLKPLSEPTVRIISCRWFHWVSMVLCPWICLVFAKRTADQSGRAGQPVNV